MWDQLVRSWIKEGYHFTSPWECQTGELEGKDCYGFLLLWALLLLCCYPTKWRWWGGKSQHGCDALCSAGVWDTSQNPGKRGSRWEAIHWSLSGSPYWPEDRDKDAERQNTCPALTSYLCVVLMNSALIQRQKGREELSTAEKEEFLRQIQLFYLLSSLMARQQGI